MWSLDTEDWKLLDADADYSAVMNGDLTDGTIILMHDIHEPSVKAVSYTHLIRKIMGDGVCLVNPAYETALELGRLLEEKGLAGEGTEKNRCV